MSAPVSLHHDHHDAPGNSVETLATLATPTTRMGEKASSQEKYYLDGGGSEAGGNRPVTMGEKAAIVESSYTTTHRQATRHAPATDVYPDSSVEGLGKPDPSDQKTTVMATPSGAQTPTDTSEVLAWDDPRERRNPRHWSVGARIFHTAVPSLVTFQIVFATSVTVPATASIEAAFVVSRTQALLPLSLYTLGLAFGPAIIAALSEVFGRKYVYIASQTFFLAFIGAAAAAPSFAALLVFRLLAGLLGSAAVAIGAGSIADVWDTTQQAGTYAALLYILAPFLGPTLGPLAGAYVLGDHGGRWEWTQYLLLLVGAPLWVAALLMRETSRAWITRRDDTPTTLHRRTGIMSGAQVRRAVGAAVARPTRMLCSEVVVLALSLYTAFAYAMIFSYFGSLSYVLTLWYGFDPRQVGLCFVSVIVGYLLAAAVFGAFDRTLYARAREAAAAREDKKPDPKHRLYAACLGSVFLPASLFWYAWAAREGGNWAVVVAAGIPFGLGAFSLFLSSIGYMVDFYGPEGSASAVAANGLLRYVLGAVFPLFTVQMYQNLGVHWASTVFALLSLALLPIPWLLFRYSAALQRRSRMGVVQAAPKPRGDDVEARGSMSG